MYASYISLWVYYTVYGRNLKKYNLTERDIPVITREVWVIGYTQIL
jgi:hypothetical protein